MIAPATSPVEDETAIAIALQGPRSEGAATSKREGPRSTRAGSSWAARRKPNFRLRLGRAMELSDPCEGR